MNEGKQLTTDLSSLKELLNYPIFTVPFAILSGYPACCLLFSTSWDKFSTYKQGILSSGMGVGWTVIVWILIVYLGSSNTELFNFVNGNEVAVTTAGLGLICFIEIIIMAIVRYIQIIQRRRKRRKS